MIEESIIQQIVREFPDDLKEQASRITQAISEARQVRERLSHDIIAMMGALELVTARSKYQLLRQSESQKATPE